MEEDDDNEIFMRLNKLHKEMGLIPDDAEEEDSDEKVSRIKGKIKKTKNKIKIDITIKTDD